MDQSIVWLSPLLSLPGIALLIVSTSARYSALSDEIHRWLDGKHEPAVVVQAHLVQRARHFRNALVALYITVFVFMCASLCGALLDFTNVGADAPVFVIATGGILAAGFAAFELVRESLLSLQVIEAHVNHMQEEMHNEQPTN